MSVTGFIRGHAAFWDGELWRWQDTNEPAGSTWGGKERSCPKCGELPTPEGYDACIGFVPGASSVCCGHGVEDLNPILKALTYPCREPIHQRAAEALAALASQSSGPEQHE